MKRNDYLLIQNTYNNTQETKTKYETTNESKHKILRVFNINQI